MYIWAPAENPTYLNEQKVQKLFEEPQYWLDYFNETDEAVRENYLDHWIAPGNVQTDTTEVKSEQKSYKEKEWLSHQQEAMLNETVGLANTT